MDDAQLAELYQYLYRTHGYNRQDSPEQTETYKRVALPMLETLGGTPQRGVDIGCGTGKLLSFFEPLHSVVGVDIADPVVWYPELAQFVKRPAWDLPFPAEHFHFSISTDALEHMREYRVIQCLREMARVSKDWVFILTTSVASTRSYGFLVNSLHITVRPKKWWLARMQEVFRYPWELHRVSVDPGAKPHRKRQGDRVLWIWHRANNCTADPLR